MWQKALGICKQYMPVSGGDNTQELYNDGATRITRISGAISKDEARYLKRLAKRAGFARSEVGAARISEIRTSSSSEIPNDDPVVRRIGQRLAEAAGMPGAHLDMQVVRYKKNEQFAPHLDEDEGTDNPRIVTIFVWLADRNLREGRCGGETVFTELRVNGEPLAVRPRLGDALMWKNLTRKGEVNEMTRHASRPVTCRGAVKWGMNVWLHAQPEGSSLLATKRAHTCKLHTCFFAPPGDHVSARRN